MLIQGSGCRLWRNSIFWELTEKLTPYDPKPKPESPLTDDDGDDNDDVVYSHTDTSLKPVTDKDYETPPGRVKTALNKMINKLRSPGASDKPISLSALAITNKQQENTNENMTNYGRYEVSIVKTIHTPTTATSDSEENDPKKILNNKQHLEKQMKENKQLQDTFKDIISQSKVLNNENDRLQKSIVALQEENKALKIKFHSASENIKDSEKQIKTLKSQSSKDSSKVLVLEEENDKLKKKIYTINKEKVKLVD